MSNMYRSGSKPKKMHFTAVIGKRNYQDYYKFGHKRILLRDVRIGKLLFRDHVWINIKNLEKFKEHDIIKFSARIKKYLNVEDGKMSKLGFNIAYYANKIGKHNPRKKLNNPHYKEHR